MNSAKEAYADLSDEYDQARREMRRAILAKENGELHSLYYRAITLSEHEAFRRALPIIDQLVDALKTADKAINPPDRDGISLDKWNSRLKEATAAIRAAIASASDCGVNG
jgi:small-conductance mechanosensitive channel